MKRSVTPLLKRALALPAPERALLAERLVDSLGAPPGSVPRGGWKAEIRRRCEELDSGKVRAVPAEEVFAAAKRALRKV